MLVLGLLLGLHANATPPVTGRIRSEDGLLSLALTIRQIPPDALEGWMAEQALAGLCPVLCVNHQVGLDPLGLGEFPRRFDRLRLQFLKLFENVFLVGIRESELR
jgi:hypothetical protein